MKILKTTFLLFIFSVFCLVHVYAYTGELSPAIDIIKNKTSFVKSGTTQGDVVFSAEDFDTGFGLKVSEITIQTLPPVKDGILKLAGAAVTTGQTIPRKNIGNLKFIPNSKKASRCDFMVYHSGDPKTSIKCTVSLSDGINFSPSALESAFSTQRNIAIVKTLYAYDPENDDMTFEIVSAPKNGVLTLTGTNDGSFFYQPKANFCGNDSFEYRVCDRNGNFSETEKVKIKVEKPASDIFFTDMAGHWAHNSAIRTTSYGIMPIYYDSNGYAVFNPDDKITREQFLVSAMKAVDYKTDSEIFSTIFHDDDLISDDAKCYISAAYRDEIISGYATPSGIIFDPDGEITRAQAAVIVSKLINAPSTDATAVFADHQDIPVWAADALSSLVSCGILSGMGNGSINASSPLTRAQCAEMLCAVQEYSEETQKQNSFFARLFGKNK
ncbi:MAG: S-layer homology domain-containing protein [Clostridia bacterium]|nr:S-layer homology domain-containing protein [Clostridia bacterium]